MYNYNPNRVFLPNENMSRESPPDLIVVSPFDSGSHAQWSAALQQRLQQRALTVQSFSLPGSQWKARLRVGASVIGRRLIQSLEDHQHPGQQTPASATSAISSTAHASTASAAATGQSVDNDKSEQKAPRTLLATSMCDLATLAGVARSVLVGTRLVLYMHENQVIQFHF